MYGKKKTTGVKSKIVFQITSHKYSKCLLLALTGNRINAISYPFHLKSILHLSGNYCQNKNKHAFRK